MKKLLCTFTLLFGLLAAPVSALETRTWTSLDGRKIEAEFVRMDGEKVILRGKDGREFAPISKTKLSKADQDYLTEVGAKPSGSPPTQKASSKVPTPAKELKFDHKTMVKKLPTPLTVIPDLSLDGEESDHFVVFYERRGEPEDLIEAAERMWADMNFFHPTFAQKFNDRKMPLFLIDSDPNFLKVAKWYASNIAKSDDPEAAGVAAKIEGAWKNISNAGMVLPKELAEQQKLLTRSTVLKSYHMDGKRSEKVKGVYNPSRIHSLASILFNFQAGGGSRTGKTADGWQALSIGHSYYKEISIAGKSDTLLSSGVGTDSERTISSIYQDNWAKSFKDDIRKKVKPTIAAVYQITGGGEPHISGMAYAFAQYLQSTPERIKIYEDLVSQVDTSHQMPVPEDLAKLYKFENVAAMETDWIEWIKSSNFK